MSNCEEYVSSDVEHIKNGSLEKTDTNGMLQTDKKHRKSTPSEDIALYLKSLLDWLTEDDIQRLCRGDEQLETYLCDIAADAGAVLHAESAYSQLPICRPSNARRRHALSSNRHAFYFEEDPDEDTCDGREDEHAYNSVCERRLTSIRRMVPSLSEDVIEEVLVRHEEDPDAASDMLLDLNEVDSASSIMRPALEGRDEAARIREEGPERPRLSRQDPVPAPRPARLQSQTSVENMSRKQKGTLLKMYKLLPLRALSRQFGRVAEKRLPERLRKPVIGAYVRAYHCDMEDVQEQDLTKYDSLAAFFARKLKDDARTIDPDHCLTSPSDGKVMYFGKVKGTTMEQVKGVQYSLKEFLGPQTWTVGQEKTSDYQRGLLHHPDSALYHCIVYLGPGDYHAFHAPAALTVTYRRHFPGQLLSVSPSVVQRVQGLFTLNERAVYIARWQHGFMAVTLVGATNVGSIKVNMDETLQTNRKSMKSGSLVFRDEKICNERFDKGQIFGEFSFGSTVVLVFEAPDDFKFEIEAGQIMRVGMPLGDCQQKGCKS